MLRNSFLGNRLAGAAKINAAAMTYALVTVYANGFSGKTLRFFLAYAAIATIINTVLVCYALIALLALLIHYYTSASIG